MLNLVQSAVVVLGCARLITASPSPTLEARALKGCNADNCARQVTGTRAAIPLATRRADCSSYLSTTITYDDIASTAITIAPTAYPSYISACSGGSSDRYSSACSCWGVQPTTTTIYPYDCTPDLKVGTDECGCKYTGECYTSFEGDLIDYNGFFSESECLTQCSAKEECRAVAYGQLDGFCALLGAKYTPETDLDYDKFTLGLIRQDNSCSCPYDG